MMHLPKSGPKSTDSGTSAAERSYFSKHSATEVVPFSSATLLSTSSVGRNRRVKSKGGLEAWQRRRSVAPLAIAAGECDDHMPVIMQKETDLDLIGIIQQSIRKSISSKAPVSKFKLDKFRAKEELCVVQAKTQSKNRRAWFLSNGYIGRERGDHVIIATKDGSMDPVHARVIIDGDDYLLEDVNSSTGTFICLSTFSRHHPQRDGFRLRVNDVFIVGLLGRVRVLALATADKPAAAQPPYETHPFGIDNDNDPSATSDPRHAKSKKKVRFGDIQVENDGVFPTMHSRYHRGRKALVGEALYPERVPTGLTLSIAANDEDLEQRLSLPGKYVYTIGSASSCDIQVIADGVHPVHACIVFDGHFYVLQDLSFEDNPKRKTRVQIVTPTRIGRGDYLLFGNFVLVVVNVHRAFKEHDPDIKEVAFRCQMLRPSKRKSRRREKYIPVAFRYRQAEPFVVGKGPDCDGQLYTASLCVEQFTIQLDHGSCFLIPRYAGINQGLYFLLGRNSIIHEEKHHDDLLRYTSKSLMLVEGSVFKCGNTELEVTCVKLEDPLEATAHQEEFRENTDYLRRMPWLQQITLDIAVLQNIAKRGQRLLLEPGDTVYEQGDPASFLFILLQGDVALISTHADNTSLSPGHSRLSALDITALLESDFQAKLPGIETVIEHIEVGGFFGEVSLLHPDGEYCECARALSPCAILVLSREDVCGYLRPYMSIIIPHLGYETQKDVLQKLRLYVPWFQKATYQELRDIATHVELLHFDANQMVIKDGKLDGSKRRHGLLMLRFGDAIKCCAQSSDNDEDNSVWKMQEILVLAPTTSIDPRYFEIKATTEVECFFLELVLFEHIMRANANTTQDHSVVSLPPALRRRQTQRRRSSYASTVHNRIRHSAVVVSNVKTEENDGLVEGAELEENDPSRKWRRKKRNKNLLEKTILETQQNPDFPSALVLYVLSGANRGDVHVVRNVATIGNLGSNADIELNDRYVSKTQSVIEHRDGRYWLYDDMSDWGTFVRMEESQNVQVHAGDVFLAGEIEFTCMAAFPPRNQSGLCCIQ